MMKRISVLFFTLLFSVLFFTCEKEAAPLDDKTLILGKWTGTRKVHKFTVTNTATNTIEYGFTDTLLSANNGLNFWIEFKKDSVSTEARLLEPTLTFYSTTQPQYSVSNKKLSFRCNPYTANTTTPCEEARSSTITILTEERLVLYDIDTIQLSPLALDEVTFEFYK